MKLDIKQPYYQKIIDFWQRKVIDPDDSPAEQNLSRPLPKSALANKLAVLLEYPHANPQWYAKQLVWRRKTLVLSMMIVMTWKN